MHFIFNPLYPSNSKPNYSCLQVFGSLCYGHNHSIQHKFDQRAKLGIFVGYPYAQKGYYVFDLASNIFTSRDVTFYEGIFRYRDLPHPSTLSPVTPLLVPDEPPLVFPSIISPVSTSDTTVAPPFPPPIATPTASIPVDRPRRTRRPPPH